MIVKAEPTQTGLGGRGADRTRPDAADADARIDHLAPILRQGHAGRHADRRPLQGHEPLVGGAGPGRQRRDVDPGQHLVRRAGDLERADEEVVNGNARTLGPSRRTRASWIISNAPGSACGSAKLRLPPSVPVPRTRMFAIVPSSSARTGNRSRTTMLRSICWWVAAAPIWSTRPP